MSEAVSRRSFERLREVRGLLPDTWSMPSPKAMFGLLLGTTRGPGGVVRMFRDDERLWEAYWCDELSLDETVRVGARAGARVATAGRALAASLLPRRVRAEARVEPWTAPRVRRWLREVARVTRAEVAARCSVALDALGASWAARSGASLCADDLRSPPVKSALVSAALHRVAEVEAQYAEGQITDGERYNKHVDRWSEVSEAVVRAALDAQEGTALDAMAFASPGGRTSTHRRLCAMVGLTSKSSGELVERPVLRSFGEGLDAHEGFLLAACARGRELHERARLREVDALFAELCAALGPWEITSLDCGDAVGETLAEPVDPYVLRALLYERVEGRELTRDVVSSAGALVARRGEVVGLSHRARWIGVREASVRSATTCRDADGLCARCYGRDPDDGSEVRVGERVGLRAAWAAASLVARLPAQWTTWIQVGGAQTPDRCRRARRAGRVRFADDLVAKGRAVRVGVVEVVGDDGERHATLVNEGDVLSVADGESVRAGAPLATFEGWGEQPRVAAIPPGVQARVELPRGASADVLVELDDERAGGSAWFVSGAESLDLTLRSIDDPTRAWTKRLDRGDRLHVAIGAIVARGDVIASKTPRDVFWDRREECLADLRKRLDLDVAGGSWEIRARFDGVVTEVSPHRRIVVTGAGGRAQRVPMHSSGIVRVGDVVRLGDVLRDGSASLRQRLRIFGERFVAEHLVGGFEGHAAWGGMRAPRVHWELIARAMLAWRRVRRPGDTGMRRDKVYSLAECARVQRETAARGGAPAELVTVLRGIGRMAGRRWMLSRRDRIERRVAYERECRRLR